LFGGGWLVSRGEISIGTLYAFITYLGILLWPIRQMGRTLTDTGKAVVAFERITEVLNSPQEADNEVVGPLQAGSVKGHLLFKNLDFRFYRQVPVLSNISFEVKPGETIAIVGPTGSGKTTLINLLLRLYNFEVGFIELDGVDIRQIPRKQLRKVIGAVLQEPFIYTKTAKENINLADESKQDKAIYDAARDACIHHSIRSFKKGYDTEIGERGVTLSGGQKQRVTMARSFLKTVPILIWDDALSAVDSATEAQILETLQSRYGKLTTILITHRLSVCQNVDHVFVMDKGTIAQRGTHESLITQDGFYKTVWDIQNLRL
jgi:ATP-binding cassette subfamily B protein